MKRNLFNVLVISVLILGLVGCGKTKKENSKKDNKSNESFTYVGSWKDSGDSFEIKVTSINDTEVVFDLAVIRIASFDNVKAIKNGEYAPYEINEDIAKIKGSLVFVNNKIILNINESSNENIPTGNIELSKK